MTIKIIIIIIMKIGKNKKESNINRKQRILRELK